MEMKIRTPSLVICPICQILSSTHWPVSVGNSLRKVSLTMIPLTYGYLPFQSRSQNPGVDCLRLTVSRDGYRCPRYPLHWSLPSPTRSMWHHTAVTFFFNLHIDRAVPFRLFHCRNLSLFFSYRAHSQCYEIICDSIGQYHNQNNEEDT